MRDRKTPLLIVIAGTLLLSTTAAAQQGPRDTACGPEVRQEIVELLAERGKEIGPRIGRELRERYGRCAEEGEKELGRDGHEREYCGRLPFAGSLFYERLRCCGYEPQKQLWNCPVEVLQPNGFGAFPVPGSYEYVLSCVLIDNTWVPAGEDRVHLTDAVDGRPVWQSAVTAEATDPLASLPLDGRTLRARSILSWNLPPGGDCDYRPTWGNVIEYQIRLDPTDTPPPPAAKIVFATSTTHNGNLGHFAGANQICQQRATAAGLSGTFKAWLSGRPDGFGDQNAADMLTQATVPYVLPGGAQVADDWNDLTDGSLDHPINRDEFGNAVSGNVWTNTRTNGDAFDHRRDCGPGSDLNAVWRSASQFESGHFGVSTATNATWTSSTNTACDNQFRLYCFEQ